MDSYDDEDERPLLSKSDAPKSKVAAAPVSDSFFTASNLLLLFYVVMAIIVGTANRVSFKLMQLSIVNYSYFVSQLTTFIYLPVNFGVILFKLLFTDHITPEMTRFPKWKFLIMGTFDSLQGLLIVVGGTYVPGIMQNLLLQGAVPVTMLFSLLMLRHRGDAVSRTARHILQKKGIVFREIYAGDDAVKQAGDNSVCRILVNGRDIGDVPALLQHETPPSEDVFQRFFMAISSCCRSKPTTSYDIQGGANDENDLSSVTLFSGIDPRELHGDVALISDAHSWGLHFKRFYSLAQYIGAAIIMGGLVVSVWPAFGSGGGAGPLGWDLVFFSSTISIAISGVYKEIAFDSVSDMDVWYLNGWVALPQFLVGLLYAPLAAVMVDLPVPGIPQNLWRGLQCWMLGTNFVETSFGSMCSNDLGCGVAPMLQCCDSCNGMLPNISSMPALYAVVMYMCFNIAYNVFLVLVIKHGSAALFYATSTVLLPLGSIAFTFNAFMGKHAQPFDEFTGIGLGVVLLGLLTYRFADTIWKKIKTKKD